MSEDIQSDQPGASHLGRLRVGMAVVDIHYQAVGTIAGIGPSSFAVELNAARTLWLSEAALFNVDRAVTLICSVLHIDRYTI